MLKRIGYTLVGGLIWLGFGITYITLMSIVWLINNISKWVKECYYTGKRVFNPKWVG